MPSRPAWAVAGEDPSGREVAQGRRRLAGGRALRRKPRSSPAPAPGSAPERPAAQAAGPTGASPAGRPLSAPAALPAPAAAGAAEGVRLSKIMSERGICRAGRPILIERGWVFVDGQRISELGTRIDPRRNHHLAAGQEGPGPAGHHPAQQAGGLRLASPSPAARRRWFSSPGKPGQGHRRRRFQALDAQEPSPGRPARRRFDRPARPHPGRPRRQAPDRRRQQGREGIPGAGERADHRQRPGTSTTAWNSDGKPPCRPGSSN